MPPLWIIGWFKWWKERSQNWNPILEFQNFIFFIFYFLFFLLLLSSPDKVYLLNHTHTHHPLFLSLSYLYVFVCVVCGVWGGLQRHLGNLDVVGGCTCRKMKLKKRNTTTWRYYSFSSCSRCSLPSQNSSIL